MSGHILNSADQLFSSERDYVVQMEIVVYYTWWAKNAHQTHSHNSVKS